MFTKAGDCAALRLRLFVPYLTINRAGLSYPALELNHAEFSRCERFYDFKP